MVDHIKCVLVGDEGVGKTSLVISYTTNTFPGDFIPKVGDPCTSRIEMGIANWDPILTLWDTRTSGDNHEQLRPLSYPQTNVFLLCYSDRGSWESIKTKWHPEISHHCPGTPFLLVGTKKDWPDDADDALVAERKSEISAVHQVERERLANKLGAFKSMECSALTEQGLRSVFEEAAHAHRSHSMQPKSTKPKSKSVLPSFFSAGRRNGGKAED